MFRSIVLLAALVFVVGCKKGKDAESDNSNAPRTGDGPANTKAGAPNSGGEPSVTQLQARAKFKLARDRDLSLLNDPALHVSADGRTFAVRLKNSQICVYDVAGEPKLIGQYNGSKFALSPSGKYLFTAGNTFDRTVIDLASKKPIAKAGPKTAYLDSTAYFFRDDNTIVHIISLPRENPKGRVILWDYAKDTQSSFDIPDKRFRHSFLMHGGKEVWLVTDKYERNKFEIECYDLTEKKLMRTIKPLTEAGTPKSDYDNVTVASDGSVFAGGEYKSPIFDATSGKTVGKLPDTVFTHSAGLLPPNGRFFLCMVGGKGSKGGGVGTPGDYLLYDWKSQRVAAVLAGPKSGDLPEAIGTPDGRTLISVSTLGEVLLYDLSGVK